MRRDFASRWRGVTTLLCVLAHAKITVLRQKLTIFLFSSQKVFRMIHLSPEIDPACLC
jgi:hypothetical protein